MVRLADLGSRLTSRHLAFIELIREQYNRKVIIVIDELDKIHDPDQVKELLVEIKGALFNKGCFYLISISEDAARSFRYRLTSGRDIFESTFDEIIEIRQMDVESGCTMLSKREQNTEASNKLPEECLALLVLFGGGYPERSSGEPGRCLSKWIINTSSLLAGQLDNCCKRKYQTVSVILEKPILVVKKPLN